MDTFKRQDNDTLKKLCPPENNCDVLIVLYNLTNKFQPLNLSVNEVAKSFIQNNYNDWFADWHLRSFKIEKILPMLKYHPNFRIWSPYMREGLEKKKIVRGFNSAGISKAVQNSEDIYEKIENPFRT